MINFLRKLIRSRRNEKDKVSYNSLSYLKMSESAILLPSTRFDFRNGYEDRIYVAIGNKCLLNTVFTFETVSGQVLIGDNVHIGHAHFICRTKIEIEDDVTMAWGIVLYDHDSHSLDWEHRKNDNYQSYDDYIKFSGNGLANKDWTHVNQKPIRICSKVWIGFDVVILKGVTIGEGAIVGAKSVVTKDVRPWTVVAGNPAREIKELKKSS